MKILMKINERPEPNIEHESMRPQKKPGARRAACWRLIVQYPCVCGVGQHLLTEQSKTSQLEQLLNYSNFHLSCLPHWCWDTRAKLGHIDVGTTPFPRTLQIPAEERDVPYQKGKYKECDNTVELSSVWKNKVVANPLPPGAAILTETLRRTEVHWPSEDFGYSTFLDFLHW